MSSPRANFPCPIGIGHQAWARISLLIDPAPRPPGHVCVKGRFGFEFVQRRAGES